MGVVVLGSLNLDVVCRVESLPAPGETVAGLGVRHFPGGKGLNQAIAAARWDAPTAMIGAVGDDAAGETLLAALTETGADGSAVIVNEAAQTGQAFIFVSAAGENVIVVAGGANLVLTPPPRFDLDGFTVALAQLETPVAATRALFEAVAAAGGLTLLNAAPAIEAGATLFPLADIIIVNETELARYAKVAASPERIEDIAALGRSLICRPAQRVVVTLGAAGALSVAADGIIQVPGRAAKVVDTTGAGDCFCGVLAAALSGGADLAEAMAQANAAAALSTEVHGAAVSMPGRAQVTALAGGS
ncbi:MAG TPA: ribokinase [Caulobacteraceae bacterium]|jgi:ribokinase